MIIKRSVESDNADISIINSLTGSKIDFYDKSHWENANIAESYDIPLIRNKIEDSIKFIQSRGLNLAANSVGVLNYKVTSLNRIMDQDFGFKCDMSLSDDEKIIMDFKTFEGDVFLHLESDLKWDNFSSEISMGVKDNDYIIKVQCQTAQLDMRTCVVTEDKPYSELMFLLPVLEEIYFSKVGREDGIDLSDCFKKGEPIFDLDNLSFNEIVDKTDIEPKRITKYLASKTEKEPNQLEPVN